MVRHFSNFLEAYYDYAKDGFVPDKFHYWTGVSIIAAALERKVWLPWNDTYVIYPNIYTMLISKPAIGKSTAINRGVGLLNKMRHEGLGHIKMLPSQITEARLVEIMSHAEVFDMGTTKAYQCAGFYYASEASACLKDITGSTGLVPTITAFYDCDNLFEKATVSMGEKKQTIINICFNLLAGATFDYLGKLVTDENIQGGFASRLIYVMQREFWDRDVSFQDRKKTKNPNAHLKLQLTEDLAEINKMVGPFSADKGYAELWEDWFKKHDRAVQTNPSPSMQALLGRKHTTMNKLPMILSASESDDRILKSHHFEKALSLVEEVERELPEMLRDGKAKVDNNQSGINNAILAILDKSPSRKIRSNALVNKLVLQGFEPGQVEKTIYSLSQNGELIRNSGTEIQLIGNANDYL